MSDNVTITAGAGTTVASDNVAGAHYQRMKLAIGADASAIAIGHAEDSGHTTADGGIMALAVRNDSSAALSGTDLDYTPIAVDSAGRLKVATVETSITPGTAATHLGKAEDAAHVSGDTGVAILTKRTDSAASSAGTDGDYATLNTDASGRVWVNVGAVGSGATDLAKLEDAAHASGDAGVMGLAVRKDAAAVTSGSDGDYSPLIVDATGRLWARSAGMGGWTKNHAPAAATQATISQAAAGAGIKNVCTSISVSLSSAAAPTVGVVTFNLRDGATGAGTILWTLKLSLPATAGLALSESIPVWIEGTANTAMTLETAAAPAANVQATVAMTGTTI